MSNVKYSFYYNELKGINNIVIPNEGNISFSDFKWGVPTIINYPGNIVRSLSYDGKLNLESIVVKDNLGQTFMNYSYTRSNAGNIINIETEEGMYTYGYDSLSRVSSANYPLSPNETFTYDSLNNRKTDNATLGEWLYNQNNQLLSSPDNIYLYDANGSQTSKKDANGQLIQEYIYNTENKLSEIRGSGNEIIASYYYDPFGRRLSKTIYSVGETKITYFHYNNEGLSAEKTDDIITSYLFNPNDYWSTNPI